MRDERHYVLNFRKIFMGINHPQIKIKLWKKVLKIRKKSEKIYVAHCQKTAPKCILYHLCNKMQL